MKDESAGLRQSQFHGETGTAKAGIPAERRLGPVTVIVAHPDIARRRLREEHHAVSPNPCTAGRQRRDRLGVLQVRRGAGGRVENDEVVSGSRHLVETLALWPWHHQILPVKLHQRRRQTIQIASRTIFLDILLTPSARSTKMIGISTRRKPRFQARYAISIGNA